MHVSTIPVSNTKPISGTPHTQSPIALTIDDSPASQSFIASTDWLTGAL